MRRSPTVLALLPLCIGLPAPASGVPGEVFIDERYDWPDGADVRLGAHWGDLTVVARRDRETAALGASLPWLQVGPLFGRGIFRQMSGPLSFSAWSGVFEERTALVLDSSLRSARPGAVLMPLPGLIGVFVRGEGAGGSGCGAFGGFPIGAGAAVEGLLLRSRPEPRGISEDWYFDRSPFPGGDVTHLCGRLMLDSPWLDFSFTAGSSASSWASPGSFAMAWLRARAADADAAVLLSGVTPGYRTPDGDCAGGESLVSAGVRLGEDRRTGTLEAGWSGMVQRPGFAPGLEIPTRGLLRLALSREFATRPDIPLSVIVQAEKEISRDANGVEVESARCSSAVSVCLGQLEARTAVSLSGDGAFLGGSLTVRPSSRLRLGVEAQVASAAAASPTASLTASVSLSGKSRKAALRFGFEDYPLHEKPAPLARLLRLTLSTSIRAE